MNSSHVGMQLNAASTNDSRVLVGEQISLHGLQLRIDHGGGKPGVVRVGC
jgi:hypothetical protein